MKKSAYIFAASLALATVLSCNRAIEPEEAVTPQPAAETLTFRAVLEQPDTKASLNSDYAVVWEAGDQIAVYNGTEWVSSEPLTDSAIENSGRYATFSVNIAEGDTYYAVYPASAAPSAAVSEDVLAVTLPDVQVIPSGGCVAKDALVQVCKTSDKDNMVFKNISSLVEFKAPEALDGYVRFEAFDAEGTALQVAGAASVNAAAPAAVSGNAGKVIVKGSFAAGQNYFAVVYPQSGVSSFRFAFSKEDATNGTLKAFKTGSSAIDLPLNGGKKFSDLGTLKWLGPLSTKADLDKWAKYADYYLAGETVKLGADINYEGGTWKPVNGNATNNRFSGLFDGQGHSIYNIVISTASGQNCGFFANLTSSTQMLRVKDLKLGFDPSTEKADGISKIEGTNTSNTRLGALCGLLDESDVESVVNYVTVTAEQDAEIHVGGLIGRVQHTCSIKNCCNYATVDAKTTTISSIYFGGIIGTTSGENVIVSSCCNYGIVQRSSAAGTAGSGNSFIGGIVARSGGNSTITISQCKNFGTVCTSNNIKCGQLYIGGIVSMDNTNSTITGTNLIVTDCQNEETGIVKCYNLSSTSNNNGFGGIIGRMEYESNVSNCSNLGKVLKVGNMTTQGKFGGIVGFIDGENSVVTNCTNGSASNPSLGFVSDLAQNNNNTNQRIGGIAGHMNNGTISSCTNYGTVQATSDAKGKNEYFGGIVGNLTVGSILNCNCYGTVSVAGSEAKCSAGGIVGLQSGGNVNQTADGCKVNATISCGNINNAGLVVGLYTSTVTTCLGSESSPIKAKGTVNGTVATAANYESLLAGSAAGITASGVASGLNTIWATFVNE